MTHSRIRQLWRVPALFLAGALTTTLGVAANTSFTFTGQCTDCAGTATGQLVLQNYTLGTQLNNTHFVSFTYSSNLLNYSLSQTNQPIISGLLPAILPAKASVNINGPQDKVLITQSSGNGSWCAGTACADDFGSSSTWTQIGTPSQGPAGAPAMSPWMLICLAVAMAAMGGMLVRKGRAGKSA